jgi:hypothetical protein
MLGAFTAVAMAMTTDRARLELACCHSIVGNQGFKAQLAESSGARERLVASTAGCARRLRA